MAEDVGDPKQVNNKKRRYDLEQEQRREDFRRVMSTPEGRGVLWRILELCGSFKSSYQGDVHQMLINEGKRVIGLEVFAMFEELKEAGEQTQSKMTQEAKQRQRKVEGNG